MALLKSPWLIGLHEGHEQGGLENYLDKPSWIVFTEAIGYDPYDKSGKDFREWTQQGYWPIVRLNNGYEPSGTIPHKDYFEKFAQRCQNYVVSLKGDVYYFIIGNEPNMAVERPHGWAISPEDYATCYLMCRAAIKKVRPDVVVMPAPVAVWNVDTGDWLAYFKRVMQLVEGNCDGITLHTYTHGADPALITSETGMNAPYQDRNFHFRAYQDLMDFIPQSMRSLPVLITESDQNDPWDNRPNNWIQEAYREISNWNSKPENQTIQALIMYRWPDHDRWVMKGKNHVVEDFRGAVRVGYKSPEPRFFKTILPQIKQLPSPPEKSDDNWKRCLAFVLQHEGLWADDPNDSGGATMRGITIGTYTRWRKEKGQSIPTKDDLRNISDTEVEKIYFDWYWIPSKANEMSWPMCLAQFDLSVNGGVGRALETFAAVGPEFWEYMIWRRDWYHRLDQFPIFGKAWINRCEDLVMTVYRS